MLVQFSFVVFKITFVILLKFPLTVAFSGSCENALCRDYHDVYAMAVTMPVVIATVPGL